MPRHVTPSAQEAETMRERERERERAYERERDRDKAYGAERPRCSTMRAKETFYSVQKRPI